MTASKFRFSETEIRAHAGETIALVLTSVDFMHGFALPELNARIDVPPGQTVELALHLVRAGRFTYLCDNFCGDGHDRMTGVLVVADAANPANRRAGVSYRSFRRRPAAPAA